MRCTSKMKKMIIQVIIQNSRQRSCVNSGHWLWMAKHKGSTCEWSQWLYKSYPVQNMSKWPTSNSTLWHWSQYECHFNKLFDSLKHKPKVLQCNRALRGARGKALIPKGECFLQIKIGKKTFRDWVIIIKHLNCDYIISATIQRSYHM